MGNTIYASFDDQSNAEKAVGALLDNGVRQEDISVIRNHTGSTVTAPVAGGETFGEENSNTTVYQQQTGGEFVEQPSAIGNNSDTEYMPSYTPGVAGTSLTDSTFDSTNSDVRDNRLTDEDDVAYRAAAARSTGTYADDSNLDVTDRNLVDYDNRSSVGEDTAGYRATDAKMESTENRDNIENTAKHGLSTTTPADAGKGAIKGTEWGLGIGIVAALASLFIPGVGLVLGAGALAAGIGAAAATAGAGAASGAITGYLKDQGMDEAVAHRYSDTINRGGAMIAVTVPSGQVDEVRVNEILAKYGSSNVNSWNGGSGVMNSTGGYVS